MEPIMAVWAGTIQFFFPFHFVDFRQGFALQGASVPQAQLGPYVQQAIDQVSFLRDCCLV